MWRYGTECPTVLIMTASAVSGDLLDLTVDQAVGELVHQQMWRRRIPQSKMAGVIGITQSAFSKKLRGARSFSIGELLVLAEVFEVPVTELLPHVEAVPGPDTTPDPGTEPPGGIEPPTFSLRVKRSTD